MRKRGTLKWWAIEYSVFRVGGSVTFHFDRREKALRFARRQSGGDWVVWRHGPFNRSKRIASFGGHWSDWPDYPEEDY